MKRLTVLGATGSVGRRALELIEHFPGQFRVEGLAARGSNPDLVAELCRTHRPRAVALADERAVDVLARALGHPRPEILGGARGLVRNLTTGEILDEALEHFVIEGERRARGREGREDDETDAVSIAESIAEEAAEELEA